jgi:hypothetical protein
MREETDDETNNPFENMIDGDVEDGYFAAIEHLRAVTALWWREFGGMPDVEFNPFQHYVPETPGVEREQRLLSLIEKARHDLTEITTEYDARDIAGQRLQEYCEMVREDDHERGVRPSARWCRVCILCKECGHRGAASIRDGTTECVRNWRDGATVRKMRCTHCRVVGYAEAMIV